MIAALLLLVASAIPFDAGQHPTSDYVNNPTYIHVPSFPFGIPVAPAACVAYKLESTYEVTNCAVVISNPYPFPMTAISLAAQIATQYQGAPGVQYPVLGGIGTFSTHVFAFDPPIMPGESRSIPMYVGLSGPFTDIFGENIDACGGGSVGIPTGLQYFHSPSPEYGFTDKHAIHFCPMSLAYVGQAAFEVAPGQYRRADFQYTNQPAVARFNADIHATGGARMFAADGTEL